MVAVAVWYLFFYSFVLASLIVADGDIQQAMSRGYEVTVTAIRVAMMMNPASLSRARGLNYRRWPRGMSSLGHRDRQPGIYTHRHIE
jgi:hypothetical protein